MRRAGLTAGFVEAASAGAITATWNFSAGTYAVASVASFFSTDAPAALVVTTAALPEGFVGAAYAAQLTALGGVAPYTWSIASGALPQGLALSAAGALSGAPLAAVSRAPVAFAAVDAHGVRASSPPLTLTVAAAALNITTASCPGGKQYQAYAGCSLQAVGGTPPYTWSWLGGQAGFAAGTGALPEGLTISPTSGVISSALIGGQGAYTTAIVVTDVNAATASALIAFSIAGDSDLSGTGCVLFPPDSIFHTNIASLPVDTSPAAPVDAPYLSAEIHPFFGGGAYPGYYSPNGIPFIRVPASTPNASVSTQVYQSDFSSAPYPLYAAVEGSANSGFEGNGGDRHTLVIREGGGCALFEMWQGRTYDPTSNTTWTDSSNALWPDLSSNALRPNGDGSSDACGLPVAPLLINYDETCGPTPPCVPGVIRHATRFTLNHMLANWVWPARADAGVGDCTYANGTTARGVQLGQGAAGPQKCSMSGPWCVAQRRRRGRVETRASRCDLGAATSSPSAPLSFSLSPFAAANFTASRPRRLYRPAAPANVPSSCKPSATMASFSPTMACRAG